MTRVLKFTHDNRGNNRLRFIHEGLSKSPLAGSLDEQQTRRYVALLGRLEDASIADPAFAEAGRLDYVGRVLRAPADVEVSDDEINQVCEFVWSVPWVGWLRIHVLDAINWVRNAPQAE